MGSPEIQSGIVRAGAVLLLLALAACAPSPGAMRAPSSANRFVVGDTYTSVLPVPIKQRGKMLLLANPASRTPPNDPEARRAGTLPTGTRVRIDRARSADTLTHGEESWPEGVVLDGPWAGTRIAMAQHDLRNCFHRGVAR